MTFESKRGNFIIISSLQWQTGTVPGKVGMGQQTLQVSIPHPLAHTSKAEVCYGEHLQSMTSQNKGQAGRVA